MWLLLLMQLNLPIIANSEACAIFKEGTLPPLKKATVTFNTIQPGDTCYLVKGGNRVYLVE